MTSTKFHLGHTSAARLTPESVIEMRRLYAQEGWTQGRLSRHFRVSVGQVGRIVRGESWQRYTQVPHERELEDRAANAPPMTQGQLDEINARLAAKLAEASLVPSTDTTEETPNDTPDNG